MITYLMCCKIIQGDSKNYVEEYVEGALVGHRHRRCSAKFYQSKTEGFLSTADKPDVPKGEGTKNEIS